MPLQIVRNDITKMKVDAIVSAVNESLLGGGVDGCIHRTAGLALLVDMRRFAAAKPGTQKSRRAIRCPANMSFTR